MPDGQEEVVNLGLDASQTTLLAVVLIGYLIGLLLVSLYAKGQVKDEEDYLVAGRRLPLFLAWGTLMATWFGAASMMGACEAAREEGILGTILDPFACGVTLILAGIFFAGPLWKMKLLTMGDYYRQQYGTKAEILSCCIQVPGYFAWIAAQYVALAGVQEAYFGIPMRYGILIAAGVTLTYTLMGGMWSVTLTDTLQLVVALAGLVILGYVTFSHVGNGSVVDGVQRMFNESDSKKLAFFPSGGSAAVILIYFGTWGAGLLGNIPGQDLQQRVFASKGPSTARWACILAGVLYLAFGMIPVSLGLCSNITHPGDAEEKILVLLAKSFFSPVMMVIFTVSVVSIVISTATSAVLAPATMLGHNLLGRLRVFDGHHLFMEKLSVVFVTLGGIALAGYSKKIMNLLDVSLSVAMVALFVPMVMGMYGKPRGQLSALLAMSLGLGFWLARKIFEEGLVPLPEGSELEYHDYLQTVKYPAERVGGFLHRVISFWGLVPDSLWGLGMSFVGYFTGQLLTKPIEHTDQQLETEGEDK